MMTMKIAAAAAGMATTSFPIFSGTDETRNFITEARAQPTSGARGVPTERPRCRPRRLRGRGDEEESKEAEESLVTSRELLPVPPGDGGDGGTIDQSRRAPATGDLAVGTRPRLSASTARAKKVGVDSLDPTWAARVIIIGDHRLEEEEEEEEENTGLTPPPPPLVPTSNGIHPVRRGYRTAVASAAMAVAVGAPGVVAPGSIKPPTRRPPRRRR